MGIIFMNDNINCPKCNEPMERHIIEVSQMKSGNQYFECKKCGGVYRCKYDQLAQKMELSQPELQTTT